MDKQTAINKIRKCMALAKSSEPHEAAAAMRQAQKLMEQFGVEHPELLAAGVSEDWSKSAASKTPTRYEVTLASMIASAFTCEIMFSRRLNKSCSDINGGYSFIGCTPSPEIAAYTFTVLRRQLLKARTVYSSTALKRHRKNKTAAADLFCEGWVAAVRGLIARVAPSAEQTEAINAYMSLFHSITSTVEPRSREISGRVDPLAHRTSGYREGRQAQLHQGVTDRQIGLLGAQ